MSTTWLKIAVVAEELDVSPRTVLRWIASGELAAVKLPGGDLRVSEAELTGRLASWSTAGDGRMLGAVDQEGQHATG